MSRSVAHRNVVSHVPLGAMDRRTSHRARLTHNMIKVSHLTKRYPGHTAVRDLTFDVARGEIVGFLGPNGAGKTTTMRILAGYLSVTGGKVLIGGRDVSVESLLVRRSIGYLPEHCALYPEMRVSEYLRYRGKLKGLSGRRLKKRWQEVLEQCGLGDTSKRLIGHLSKGYRQRVGLADALIHEPELLILDEPTIGLDPNQILQIRALIKSLAARHTVLLSTHILPEVEAVCERVLILHRGRIVAADEPMNLNELLSTDNHLIAEIRAPREELMKQASALPGVESVSCSNELPWLHLTVRGEGSVDLRAAVFDMVVYHKWKLRELRSQSRSLEEVFSELTRDGVDGVEL